MSEHDVTVLTVAALLVAIGVLTYILAVRDTE